ncbi:B3/B4 domain-containing protein [Rubrobacter aplysinae]|uniref:B3/B4 domain-containing protein n=1 Tax=Rubrobacter aplysinae TaxID=909625 RepID=UPI00064BBCCD|nr:phenylalanine--tRNA ligase beta subunit-related protein [Rubrobacter aplysinae]
MFAYDATVAGRYPEVHAGVLHATGLQGGESSPKLLDEYRAEQRAVAGRLDSVSIAELAQIAAWRRVFSDFGAKPTQYRNAAEALLRRLSKHGDIPTINALVDIGNLVSIRYAMPVAVFDMGKVAAPITVKFATGDEGFTDLGSTETVQPDTGEVIFADADGGVCARRWCWRQSAGSVTGPDTTEALFVIEGHHDSVRQDIESALADLTSLLATHQPESEIESYVLSPSDHHAG